MPLVVRFPEGTDEHTAKEQLENSLEFARGSGVLEFEDTSVDDIEPAINSRPVTVVTVTDPDSRLPVEVAIIKLETGGMVGVDASFLSNTDEPVYSPFDFGTEINVEEVDKGTDPEKREFVLPRGDIQEAARLLGEASKYQDVPPYDMVKLIVSDVLGHAWVDDELEASLLESVAGLFDGVTLEPEEEDEDDEAE